MIYKERKAAMRIEVSSLPQVFIYFLLDHGEVVYVGQTRHGLARPFQHTSSKKFDEIVVIPCKADELDATEGEYILKYKPIYNLKPNAETHCRLLVARNKIRECGFKLKNYTVSDLKKAIKALGIKTSIFNGNVYISKVDINRVVFFEHSLKTGGEGIV